MKKKINNVHLTYEGRLIIENLLNEGKTITEISYLTRRDRSGIAKEINKHKVITYPSTFNNTHPCIKYESCTVKGYNCYLYCKNIKINLCSKLISSPHVCNSCSSKKGCRHVRYNYKALDADCEYRNNWKNDRLGLHYTEIELNILNNDFYYLVLQNKSIYHSLNIINKRGFNFKRSTIYKQIGRGQLRLKRTDLPRKRTNTNKEEVDKTYKRNVEGHTYEDYEKYHNDNPNAIEMQMDTVEGVKNNNEPVILTLKIVKIQFLLMFKLDRKTNNDVIKALSNLEDKITKETFDKIIEILLTDNGAEFISIEKFKEVFESINIFYCHPYASYEKGSIENNHELIRRIIPKGVSLKPYTQKDYNLMCCHINSLCREELDGKCPFDLVNEYISLDKLEKLGIYPIKDEDVTLIPELLGNKNIENIKKYLDYNEIKEANIRFLTKDEKGKIFGGKYSENE